MKKVLAVLTVALSLTHMAYSKTTGGLYDGVLQAQATEQTRTLANFIGINEFEYLQIKKLNEARLLAIREASVEYEDKGILALHLRDINRGFEESLLSMLDRRQKKAYEEFKKSSGGSFLSTVAN